MTTEKVRKISHLQHVLLRPDSYVGSVNRISDEYWIIEGEKFKLSPVTYSPALLKIFDEVLVNALDRNSIHPTETTKIGVTITDGEISVENNGPLGGLVIAKSEEEGLWIPELTFGHLLTSTNYNDTTDRIVGGRNGYGAKLANIFSTKFSIKINDGHKCYVQSWSNNMSHVNAPKITKSSLKPSVKISFTPDWGKFGMTAIDQHFEKIIEKRVWDAVACTSPKCAIWFQGQKIHQLSWDSYVKKYITTDAVATIQSDDGRWMVSVAKSPFGEFSQVSFVNGICTTRGGTHVDYVTNQICRSFTQDSKLKTTWGQIKGTLFVFVRSTLVNPTFSSQVKSECTLKSLGSFSLPQKFLTKVSKIGIFDELVTLTRFKEQRELKKTDGSRKSVLNGIPKLEDATWAGTTKGRECTLIITEGDSAKTLAIAGLSVVGRVKWGVFPLRGKCKNVRDASVKQLLENQEFNDLKKIIGLQQGKKYTSLGELRYGRLMIMTDADNDGSHIKGLVLNMIHFFWPSLLELGFVVSMVTPILKAFGPGGRVKSYYTEAAYKNDPPPSAWKVKYYKGLGTSTSKEAQEYFKAIDTLTVGFHMDEATNESIVLAFDKTKSDARKTWIMDANPQELQYGKIKKIDITQFIHNDLVNFSISDVRRSIAHLCDGLKPSQRKVMFACFQKNLTSEMKVAQLAAYVSEKTSYHHGEVSLAETIVKLAQDYVGGASNNIKLLEPCGQFGTRLMGGKDASQTRYIFTKLSPEARRVFSVEDDPILQYLTDEGVSIEPKWYITTLPMILVNGTEGIGTGFSSYVPPFNPEDIISNIKKVLNNEPITPMKPWWRGFRGTVETAPKGWIATGIWNSATQTVEELPPGRWTQDYKEFLDTLVESKKIDGYVNLSTTEKATFQILGWRGEDPIKELKLSVSISSNNMHLIHPGKGITKYSTVEEILGDFISIRLKMYKKRRSHLMDAIKQRIEDLSNRIRFIQMVCDEKIVIFKRRAGDIKEELRGAAFTNIDSLLSIPTLSYTTESITKMMKEEEVARKRLDYLEKSTANTLWIEDLKIV